MVQGAVSAMSVLTKMMRLRWESTGGEGYRAFRERPRPKPGHAIQLSHLPTGTGQRKCISLSSNQTDS